MSALVNFLTILDNYILKQTSKKHEDSIEYSKTLAHSRTRTIAEGRRRKGGGLSAEGKEDMFYGQLLLVLYSD